MKPKLITLIYHIKAEICNYFDWEPSEFDPEIINYWVVQEWSGKSFDGEYTSYWFEQFVVGKGLGNWWVVYYGGTSL